MWKLVYEILKFNLLIIQFFRLRMTFPMINRTIDGLRED